MIPHADLSVHVSWLRYPLGGVTIGCEDHIVFQVRFDWIGNSNGEELQPLHQPAAFLQSVLLTSTHFTKFFVSIYNFLVGVPDNCRILVDASSSPIDVMGLQTNELIVTCMVSLV